jgi:hypothetical protein
MFYLLQSHMVHIQFPGVLDFKIADGQREAAGECPWSGTATEHLYGGLQNHGAAGLHILAYRYSRDVRRAEIM